MYEIIQVAVVPLIIPPCFSTPSLTLPLQYSWKLLPTNEYDNPKEAEAYERVSGVLCQRRECSLHRQVCQWSLLM